MQSRSLLIIVMMRQRIIHQQISKLMNLLLMLHQLIIILLLLIMTHQQLMMLHRIIWRSHNPIIVLPRQLHLMINLNHFLHPQMILSQQIKFSQYQLKRTMLQQAQTSHLHLRTLLMRKLIQSQKLQQVVVAQALSQQRMQLHLTLQRNQKFNHGINLICMVMRSNS